MRKFKVQNRTSDNRKVKITKNGGSVQFEEGFVDYVENTRDVGFCLSPINEIPPSTGAKETITLSSHPMGVDGRVSLYLDEVLTESIRYSGLKLISDRVTWFNDTFGAYVTYTDGVDPVFNLVDKTRSVRVTFEDDDIDYQISKISTLGLNPNPTLYVEQYRLAFDLAKTSIDCIGVVNRVGVLELDGTGPVELTLQDGTTLNLNSPEELIDQLRANGFTVDEILEPPAVGPELEENQEYIEISNFDYAVIRYKWSSEDGGDLDTRTQIMNPPVPGRVGWSVGNYIGGSVGNYLTWGGDNREAGVESVLLDLKLLALDNPDHADIFEIALRAFWYSSVDLGNITLELETYIGGVMEDDGFNYINVGGEVVQTVTVDHAIYIQESDDIPGQTIGYIRYDPSNNKTYLIKQNPVYQPITVAYTETYDLLVTSNDFQPFKITLEDGKTYTYTSYPEGTTVYISDLRYTDNSKLKVGDLLLIQNTAEGSPIIEVYVEQVPSSKYDTMTKSMYLYGMKGGSSVAIRRAIDDETVTTYTASPEDFNGEAYVVSLDGYDIPHLSTFKTTFTFAGFDGETKVVETYPDSPYADIAPHQITKCIYHRQYSSWRDNNGTVEIGYAKYLNEPYILLYKMDNGETQQYHFTPSQTESYARALRKGFSTRDGKFEFVLITEDGVPVNTGSVILYHIHGITQVGTQLQHINYAGGVGEEFAMSTPEEVPDSIPNTLRSFNIFSKGGTTRPAEAYVKLKNWDVSNITSLANAFRYCGWFNADISGWDVSNVRNLDNAFVNCTGLDVDLSSWDTRKVLNANNVFNGATLMSQKDYSGWYMPLCLSSNFLSISNEAYRPKVGVNHPTNPITLDSNQMLVVGNRLRYYSHGLDEYINYSGVVEPIPSYGVPLDRDTTECTIITISENRDSTTPLRFETIGSGYNDNFVDVRNFVNVENLKNVRFKGLPVQVPAELPTNITDLSNMFENVNSYSDRTALPADKQSLTYTIMAWNTSHVTKMDNFIVGTFPMATLTNLSKWDVTNIPTEPVNFAPVSDIIPPHRPIWGTSGRVGAVTLEPYSAVNGYYYFLMAKYGSPTDHFVDRHTRTVTVDGVPTTTVIDAYDNSGVSVDVNNTLLDSESKVLAKILGITDPTGWYFYRIGVFNRIPGKTVTVMLSPVNTDTNYIRYGF